jgi:lysophospholipase L1-like esterase
MKWRNACIMALGLALGMTWAAVLTYHYGWTALRRQQAQLRVGGLIYAPGPVILIGDSLMADVLPPCTDAINLATPGIRVADFTGRYLDAIAGRKPSAVVILAGINDLRSGTDPKAVADAIIGLVRGLRERVPVARVVVLSVLPIVENELSPAVRNAGIADVNAQLKTGIAKVGGSFIDVGGLFGGATLSAELSTDGLHLNARGTALLRGLLFDGLARQPSRRQGCD